LAATTLRTYSLRMGASTGDKSSRRLLARVSCLIRNRSRPLENESCVLDGFRPQEAFDGPEHDLMDAKRGGAQDAAQLN